MMQSLVMTNSKYAGADPGLDPGFLERGFICIKMWRFALLMLFIFS